MYSTSFLLACVLASSLAVQFDVQPLVPAIELAADSLLRQMPESRLVQIKLDISTIVPPEFEGTLDETTIKLITRKAFVQVADYWPRTEMYSSITTPLSVAEDYDRVRQAAIQGAAAYPGLGSASGHAYFHDNLRRDVHYEQQAPMQLLSAAGTFDRRGGVYFKLRSTPHVALEGSRSFLLTLEVPTTWRGDVLEFQAVAYGRKNAESNHGRKQIGDDRFMIAVYNEGDGEAAEYAMKFVQQQSKLRNVARQFATTIEKRAYPTPVHKLGQVLDIYEPLVPDHYLDEWMFGSATKQPNSRLPVDLRVAMLDFIDGRSCIESLAGSSMPATKPMIAHQTAIRNDRR